MTRKAVFHNLRLVAALALVGVLGGVAWHSIAEIHYLKGFFPSSFTVEQACYAAWIEVAKLVIVALPTSLGVLVLLLWPRRRE